EPREAVVPTILCFVGPPGVGKTSIGRSIAKALGRKFVKVSLGGIRDEAEIRGHRRTYVGAMPGRIIQGVRTAGTKNPVFMLDEIDKVGIDFRGDPSSALLEALDPEQNKEFSDHYLEAAFDLSEVMFITTANVLDTIPPALRDRLEVIRFSGYTEDEKFHIAKNFLLKKTLSANGLKGSQVTVPEETLKTLIKRYTKEAGVRDLERQISKIFRKVARGIAEKKFANKTITFKSLAEYLGPYIFAETLAEKRDEIGMATGLAFTQAGGDILFIEVAVVPGRGRLILTGKLGDVMKESGKAAVSYVRSRWENLQLKRNFYKHLDIHIHVPEGAVPKDGPSAGVTMTTALVSALTNTPTRREVGMTGEITLRGRVLEIGGVKEKVIAGHRAGLKEIILPRNNKKDLIKVPKEVQQDIKFHFVDHMDDVLKLAPSKRSKAMVYGRN
ncbi:MAG: endopeptidase La, partial [Candidatus Chisholmbacteria bacterium]|nr:endopeptidase La [Candidatus Chisholmbacteria bacterium]